MRRVLYALLGSTLFSALAFAAKPPTSTPNPAIAYRMLSGTSVKLMVADESGANATSLYTSSTSFHFDLAPRGRRQISIVDGTGSSAVLKLLTYTTNGSGVFVPASLQTLGPARSGSASDFSPDGTKIAYTCCANGTTEQLVVHDLITGTKTVWAEGPYFWDVSWYRDGESIAYVNTLPLEVREVTAPGAPSQLLYSSSQGELNIDSARTNRDQLVISYNDASGAARIGLWQPGGFVNADLANSARSWQGTLDCTDRKLAFMGVQNNSGSQAFYIRNLNSAQNSLVSKNSNIMLQFWPTC